MALTKIKLGKLISLSEDKNTDNLYSVDHVKGISIQKKFIETKADMDGVSLAPYLLVKPDDFAYVTVTSRNGEKITLAHNTTKDTYIVSSSYVVFRVARKDLLLSDYLFIYFNRPEFDRYARFNSWGSARETFDWDTMCDIEIELPALPTQQKYVDIYNAMVANQQSYERGLDDLKLVCDGYIEDLRRQMPCEKIGKYIHRGLKNTHEYIDSVVGIGQSGFIEPQKEPNKSLKNYKILEAGVICYAPPLYNILTGAIHLYDKSIKAVCSPIYETFYCNQEKVLPSYLILWLKREEFKRYAEFFSLGVRNTFDFGLMCQVEIPIPDITIQQSIVNIYHMYMKRKSINEKLKAQIKNICPILIRGSLEEARGTK